MEAFQEAIAAAKEQSLILKGKRTKRQRPQSPIPFSMISPPMEEKSTDLDSSKENNVENRKKDGVIITSSSSSVSYNNPTLSSKEEDEDQDIANCLILLAQGHSLPQQHLKTPYSSRKFLETSSSTNDGTTAKAGYYVYQCKTCDRTFPSFQALGGHRASHKKPKATTSFYTNLDHQLKKNIYQNDTLSLATTTYNTNRSSLVVHGKSSNNKVHECGICGAEFTSGQALGGHMRRHRGAMVAPVATVAPTLTVATANTELSLSPMSFDQVSDGTQDHLMMMPVIKRAKKSVVSLDLDLNNLPATSEDENQFMSFVSKQKQEQEEMKQREEPKSLLVLSTTPTLVDCHY